MIASDRLACGSGYLTAGHVGQCQAWPSHATRKGRACGRGVPHTQEPREQSRPSATVRLATWPTTATVSPGWALAIC